MTQTPLSVAHVDYVTDNPFRLCGIGSAGSLSKLRQRANSMAQAAKVGLPVQVGLEDIFGSEQAELCPSIVRGLATDPKRLVVYRILWPLAYGLPVSPSGTIKDLEAKLPSHSDLFVGDDSIDGLTVHALQLRFLVSWYRFLSAPHENSFFAVLTHFKAVFNDESSNVFFAELLRCDGHDDSTNELLFAAQKEVIRHLLKTACSVAAQLWQKGFHGVTLQILEQVRDCGFDPDEIATALRLVVAVGNAECTRLESLRREYGEWSPEREEHNHDSVASVLGGIASILTGHVAAARLWEQEVQRYHRTVFFAMRSYAIDALNERDDWQECQQVLEHLMISVATNQELEEKLDEDFEGLYGIMRRMSVDAANNRDDYTEATLILNAILDGPDVAGWHEKAQNDLVKVQNLEEQKARKAQAQQKALWAREAQEAREEQKAQKARTAREAQEQQEERRRQEALWTGITLVKEPLGLCIGSRFIGTTVYGRTPFAGQPNSYFTVRYLYLLGVPVFPLGRFLVSDAKPKGWDVHGTTRLTRHNQIHGLLSLLIILGFPWIGVATVLSDGARQQGSSAASSSIPVAIPSAIALKSQVPLRNDAPVTLPTERVLGTNESVSAPDSEVIAERRNRLISENNEIVAELEADQQNINAEVTLIDHTRVPLDADAARLAKQGNAVDVYDGAAVNKYNERLRRHRQQSTEFNDQVRAYNDHVKEA